MLKLVAVLLCAGLLSCASPGDDEAGVAASDPKERTYAGTASNGVSPDAAERPPAGIDSAHYIEVEDDGRGLRAAQGSTGEGGWTIRYRVSNPMGLPVYLVGCNDPPRPELQKWLGGAWKTVHFHTDDACRSPAWEIEGGGTLPRSPEWSEVRVAYDPGGHPGTESDTARRGTYRLAIALFTDDPDVDHGPPSQIVGSSAPFEID